MRWDKLVDLAVPVAFLAFCAWLIGCSDMGNPPAPGDPAIVRATDETSPDEWPRAGSTVPGVGNLDVESVSTLPSAESMTSVRAVVEVDDTIGVLDARGLHVVRGGAVIASVSEARDWVGLGAVRSPLGDPSNWMTGISETRQLVRVRASGAREPLSGRYGLEKDKVRLVAGTEKVTAFLLEGAIAIGDGRTVRRWRGDVGGLSVAGERVATTTSDGVVRIFEAGGSETLRALPGARHVAFDDAGVLLVATSRAIFRSTEAGLERIWETSGAEIVAAASAGSRIWFGVGKDLLLYERGGLRMTRTEPLGENVSLVGSPSGDVWAIAGGTLARYSARTESEDERLWRTTVLPVHARVCSHCHSPPGSGRDLSGTDLSTYADWAALRGRVRVRVIDMAGTPRAMPSPGSGFSLEDSERQAIDRFTLSAP